MPAFRKDLEAIRRQTQVQQRSNSTLIRQPHVGDARGPGASKAVLRAWILVQLTHVSGILAKVLISVNPHNDPIS